MTKRIVLLGGGHAHLQVLAALARQPLAAAQVMLITPAPSLVYSGMVPGLVAGHYQAAQCAIALAPLAAAASAHWAQSAAVGLDAGARRIRLADGRSAAYDLLSIDTGGIIDLDGLPGARELGIGLRPFEGFVDRLSAVLARAADRVLDIVVVGAGAAGVELALALQYRLTVQGQERARVALVTGGAEPLAGHPRRVMQTAARQLARRRVTVFRERCAAIEAGAVVLASGARLACDAPFIATGVQPPRWLAGSGLALDARGFVRTGPTLQSRSHAEVLAVGDVAGRDDAPLPHNGVQAVRAGPPLALNLRRAAAGQPLLPCTPRLRSLELISCGGLSAIACWGRWSAHGRWAWWWKDRIDRAFVDRYTGLAATRTSPG